MLPASRRSVRGKGSTVDSTFGPPSSAELPPAVRKLLSEDGWSIRARSCRKQVLEEPPVVSAIADDCKADDDGLSEEEELEEEEADDYFRFLGKTNQLKQLVQESAICRHCKKGELEVTFDSCCLATNVQTKCSNCSTRSGAVVQPTGMPSAGHVRTSDYAVNCLFVLSLMLSGDGGTEANKIMGLLDLPRATSMDRTGYPTLENDISVHIIEHTKGLMREALLEEVKLSADSEVNSSFNYEQWLEAWKDHMPLSFDNVPRLMVSHDMGWQKRSNGRRYDSHSGHAAVVGGRTWKPIGLVALSKLCRICSRHTGEGIPTPHDCSKNFDRANGSGSMEPQGLVLLAHQLLDDYCVTLQTTVADDDSSVRSQMKWGNPDWMTHNNLTKLPKIWNEEKKECVTLPHGGKLRCPYPEPTFLGDPQHQTKLVGKRLFGVEAKTNENNNGLNKVDCFTLKKNFGHMVKQLRTRPKTEWVEAGKAVSEHYFENHQHCREWCKRRKMSEEELLKDRKATGKFCRCKMKDSTVYQALSDVLAPFITFDRLEEIAHGHDTQINESLNNSISWFAPKNKTFCGSKSLSC